MKRFRCSSPHGCKIENKRYTIDVKSFPFLCTKYKLSATRFTCKSQTKAVIQSEHKIPSKIPREGFKRNIQEIKDDFIKRKFQTCGSNEEMKNEIYKNIVKHVATSIDEKNTSKLKLDSISVSSHYSKRINKSPIEDRNSHSSNKKKCDFINKHTSKGYFSNIHITKKNTPLKKYMNCMSRIECKGPIKLERNNEDSKKTKSRTQIMIHSYSGTNAKSKLGKPPRLTRKTIFEPQNIKRSILERNSLNNTNPSFPMTLAQVLEKFKDILTEMEKNEITKYETIYYIGNNRKTSQQTEGKHTMKIGDHIAYRYEIISLIGQGAFSKVIKCKDHKTKNVVALKLIKENKKNMIKIENEIKILSFIKENDKINGSNIIRILDTFTYRKFACIVFEHLNINLYEFLKSRSFEPLPLELISKLAFDILKSLDFLKNLNIIHCDLKPENILMVDDTNTHVKLIDFGTSCFCGEQIYKYLQSRYYRAPEIILGAKCTTAIDMWSFGCILAELFTGYPLFSGKDESEQLSLIIKIMGLPPKSFIENSSRKDSFFGNDGLPLLKDYSEDEPEKKDLGYELGCCNNDFIDIIQQCLIWEPEKRITPEEALNHIWILKGIAHHIDVNSDKKNSTHKNVKKIHNLVKSNNELPRTLISNEKYTRETSSPSFKKSEDKILTGTSKQLKTKVQVKIEVRKNIMSKNTLKK